MIKKYSYGADWFQKGGCTTVLEYRHQLHMFTYIYFQAGEEDPRKRMFFLATLWRILHVSIVLLWGPGEAQSGYSNTILDLVFLGEAQWKKNTLYMLIAHSQYTLHNQIYELELFTGPWRVTIGQVKICITIFSEYCNIVKFPNDAIYRDTKHSSLIQASTRFYKMGWQTTVHTWHFLFEHTCNDNSSFMIILATGEASFSSAST